MSSTTFTPAEQAAFAAMQARMVDLLLRRDQELFRKYFGEQQQFAGDDALGYLRDFAVLFHLRDELFEHILPRIVRRLSFEAPRTFVREEPPARGRVNWERTLAASWAERPGEPPELLHTQQRRRDFATPENQLAVATLLEYRSDIIDLLQSDIAALGSANLRHPLNDIAERCERELAFPQFAGLRRAVEQLLEQEGSSGLEQAVAERLLPGGNSAYEDLLNWRERRRELRLLQRAEQTQARDTLGVDPKRDNYLYQLWLFYELAEMLETSGRLLDWQQKTMTVRFTWDAQTFILAHDQGIGKEDILWEHTPGVRPDFFITHADRREVRDPEGALIWQEPGYILDAKYYRPVGDDPKDPAGPIKRMIADMQLTGQRSGALLFAFHGKETTEEALEQAIRPRTQVAQYVQPDLHILPLQIHPKLNIPALHAQFERILGTVAQALRERVEVRCHALAFDPLVANAHGLLESASVLATRKGDSIADMSDLLLCPKPHIAPWRLDLVSRSQDCCKNSAVCHIMHLPGIRKPKALDDLADIATALQPPDGDMNDDQVVEAATQRVRSITRRYARLLQPNIARYKRWVYKQLSIGGLFDTTPLLTDAQRETLALGRFLWEQIEQIQASNFAGPALLFSGVLEEVARASVYARSPKLYHHISRQELQRTLGTLGNSGRFRGENYRMLEQATRQYWKTAEAKPFDHWLKQVDSIARIRNEAAHEANVNEVKFDEFITLYFGGPREGLGALNALLLAWRV